MAKRKKKTSWLPWVLILGVAGTAGFLFWNKLGSAKAALDPAKTIAARAVIESCYKLRAGETIHYRFKGEDMVAFDVRRGGDGMFSPQLLPFDEGDFTADSADEYCLRFTNVLDKPQKIIWSVQRQPKP